ncbi:hypothetical protein GCM10007874_46930 [Labrys miyagiensis]|uniref:Uncharacterized protein n=1 Tax=Labrys miyagiensis TaxID=346912 RepID=A0ABQ6CMX2_9HYPH|nr:hypothetical protein [Labrys miyagiensis]GLS21676.1 hypothetical protein GCM10007874_46930 [Labrys miyagiensis]
MKDVKTCMGPTFYYVLPITQTALAVLLFASILPLFLRMIDSLGDKRGSDLAA